MDCSERKLAEIEMDREKQRAARENLINADKNKELEGEKSSERTRAVTEMKRKM